MIKKILTYPQDKEILTTASQYVEDINSDYTKEVIKDLKDTLDANPGGVGISAIQIGIPLRICLIKYGKNITMINPEITWKRSGKSGIKTFKEGCLSAPGVYAMVERAQKVTCKYYDENGNEQEISEGGWISVIIQHELDHFDGRCEVFDSIK